MRNCRTYYTSCFLLGLLFISLLFSSCLRKNKKIADVEILFGAETVTEDGKDLYAENDSTVIFKGADFRTKKASYSGDYSYITTAKNKYALGITIPDIGPDNFIQISVWKKGGNTKSHLIAGSLTPDVFYKSTNEAKRIENGWEKLELEFFIPPNYPDDELKIYVWNNSNDTVYFDDLSIRITPEKTYPTYNEEAIYIEVDTSEYLKLIDTRLYAFNTGILQTEDDDWVKGFVFGDGKMMKTKLRLKGDWLDHLYGPKWSFRLKLKSGNTWKRLRTFSLHNPTARHGVDEWFLHKVFESQDLLTTRYGFVPTYLNNKNLGIYAWEEHFTKQLIESQDKREGPIVRFFEDVYWDEVRGRKAGMDSIKLPFFEAAVIKPFSSAKVLEDSAIFNQYLIAQNLMLQYKHRSRPTSEIFNIDAFAKYFALNDIFQAYHSIIWHNQRFYYNPVLCKLEPIAFDAYTELGFFDFVDRTFYGDLNFNSVNLQDDQFLMLREIFNDYSLLNEYIKYLELYSSPDFLEQVTRDYANEAMVYDSLIRFEFPHLVLDIPRLYENADQVRNDLPAFKNKIIDRQLKSHKWKNVSKTEKEFTTGLDSYYAKNLVLAYKMKQVGDSAFIRVVSFFTDPVLLLGVGRSNQKIREFLHPEPQMEAYQYGKETVFETWIHHPADYLFVMAGEEMNSEAIEIMQWPEPDGAVSPMQDLMSRNKFPDLPWIESVKQNIIKVKNEEIVIDQPVIIPEGYELIIEAGTTIDMVNKATIISYSPVFINGNSSNPVLITSSDFSSNGLTVLQANKRSKINHVLFENLNTLNYKGWTLTGAVTFYESDVDINHARFYRNQCEDALNIIRSDFTIDQSEFEYIFGDAFDSDFSTGMVLSTVFKNIGNDAIDFSGSTIAIKNTGIVKANDKGISGGEKSNLVVENTTITGSGIGIASKDLSIVEVYNSKIIDCNIGLVLLQKKPEYGSSKMTLTNTLIKNPKTKMMVEKGSVVKIDNDIFEGTEDNLAEQFY